MEIQTDFRDLFVLLNKHEVEYLIVGGYALAFHGAPRYTGDIDVFVKPELENAQRVLSALDDFGFASLGLSVDDFSEPDKVIQLGVPPVRIDLITSISGVHWKTAHAGRVGGVYGDVPVFFIGRSQLIANKKTIGRQKDLADIESLGE